jgi:8-amino-7-oxononanoate synthase
VKRAFESAKDLFADRSAPFAWLATREQERRAAGLRRSLHARPPVSTLVDLASNDYLGLARDPRIVDAACEATRMWGAGSTGSRLVTGTTQEHLDLEEALAAFVGTEAALVFSSGYLANLGAVAALSGAGTLVVSDATNHASIVDACRLSRADVAVAAHRHVASVDSLLAGRTQERALVVTDSVFSVEGEAAPLGELAESAARHGAGLVVDEAHALGVCGPGGRGLAAAHELAGREDVVLTLTLSKSLGSQGGAVLGSRAVIDHLIDAARPFIFDTGLAPASVAAVHAALDVLAADPGLAGRASERARDLALVARAVGLDPSTPDAAVVAIPLSSPEAALAARDLCREHGVDVGCFRPPSVPDGISRLRLTARADLTDDDLTRVGTALAAVAAAEAARASQTARASRTEHTP